jgi:tetratricopeptide (TPR) repeat protein
MFTGKKFVCVLVSLLLATGLTFAELSSRAKKAEKLVAAGKIEEAMEVYTDLMGKDPKKDPDLVKEGREGMANCLVLKAKDLYVAKKYIETKSAADYILRDYKETAAAKDAAKYFVLAQCELSKALLLSEKYDAVLIQSKNVIDKVPAGTDGLDSLKAVVGSALYAQGRKAFDDEDLEAAVSKYEAIIKDYPQTDKLENAKEDLADASLELGASLTAEKNYDEAVSVFRKVMTEFPDDPDVVLNAKKGLSKILLAQADDNIAAKKYEEAIKNLNAALGVATQKEGEAQCKYALGVCFGKTKQNEKAVSEYNDVVANYPDTTFASASYADLYTVYTDMGNKKQALDSIEHAVTLAPDNSDYLFKQMQLQYELGKTQEAQGSATKLIAMLQDDLSKTYTNKDVLQFRLGQSYMVLGKYTEAIVEFDKALTRNPDMREAKKSLAFSQFNDKDYKGSIDTYESLIKQYSADFSALSSTSSAESPGELDKQKDDTMKDIAYFHFRTGLSYEQLSYYDKALAECKAGLEGVSTQEAADTIKRLEGEAGKEPEKKLPDQQK